MKTTLNVAAIVAIAAIAWFVSDAIRADLNAADDWRVERGFALVAVVGAGIVTMVVMFIRDCFKRK